MKIRCEVLEVSTNGEQMAIRAQGTRLADASWRPMSGVKFEIADNKKNQRAFHVGRLFDLNIKLKN